MKKKVKKGSRSDWIRKAEKEREKFKGIRELCEKVCWRFIEGPHECNLPGSPPLALIHQKIVPWEDLGGADDENWDRLYEAMQASFAFGYVLGQWVDIPDIDITPIKELLRNESFLLYVPHEKKAA